MSDEYERFQDALTEAVLALNGMTSGTIGGEPENIRLARQKIKEAKMWVREGQEGDD